MSVFLTYCIAIRNRIQQFRKTLFALHPCTPLTECFIRKQALLKNTCWLSMTSKTQPSPPIILKTVI